MPIPTVEPRPPVLRESRFGAPEEAQDTSYLAASAKMANFSGMSNIVLILFLSAAKSSTLCALRPPSRDTHRASPYRRHADDEIFRAGEAGGHREHCFVIDHPRRVQRLGPVETGSAGRSKYRRSLPARPALPYGDPVRERLQVDAHRSEWWSREWRRAGEVSWIASVGRPQARPGFWY